MRLHFVRHGQTPDNAERMWQGWGGRGLSPTGRVQAGRLAERLASREFTRVLSSDIERVLETSAFLGQAVEVDARWREVHVGQWAGRRIADTYAEHPEVLEGLRNGDDVRIGGDGESISEFHDRIQGSLRSLLDQHDDGDEVLVVSHGGVIGGLTAGVFGTRWPMSPTAPLHNTSITSFDVAADGSLSLTRFNDDTHLDDEHVDLPDFLRGARRLRLIRHGESTGNLSGAWEGKGGDGLSSEGVLQVKAAAASLELNEVVSSDAPRALETARLLAPEVRVDEGLRELDPGSWEGLTFDELVHADPSLANRIYRGREDLPRGGDGETWAELAERMRRTVDGIVEESDGDVTIVSHGSAIRAYLLDLMGLGWAEQPRLATMPNTGLAEVLLLDGFTRLHTYGLAPWRGEDVAPGR
ncbi:MAG: histidine phosphatase family protein [Acidimicrobiia bacterium]|nr:MAG: histidine phosphatase family protein [Acidimicrobiia bacterium]